MVSLYPYEAVHPDDLGFKKGEKMKILEEWVSDIDDRLIQLHEMVFIIYITPRVRQDERLRKLPNAGDSSPWPLQPW